MTHGVSTSSSNSIWMTDHSSAHPLTEWSSMRAPSSNRSLGSPNDMSVFLEHEGLRRGCLSSPAMMRAAAQYASQCLALAFRGLVIGLGQPGTRLRECVGFLDKCGANNDD